MWLSSILALGKRHTFVGESNRWAGRSSSQQLRRRNWTPPDLNRRHRSAENLERYSSHDYLIGNATPVTLVSISRRFSQGPSPQPDAQELDSSVLPLAELDAREVVRSRNSAENLRERFERAELDSYLDNQTFEIGETFEIGDPSPTDHYAFYVGPGTRPDSHYDIEYFQGVRGDLQQCMAERVNSPESESHGRE